MCCGSDTGETVCSSTFGGIITSGGGFSDVNDRLATAPWQVSIYIIYNSNIRIMEMTFFILIIHCIAGCSSQRVSAAIECRCLSSSELLQLDGPGLPRCGYLRVQLFRVPQGEDHSVLSIMHCILHYSINCIVHEVNRVHQRALPCSQRW